MCLGIWKNDWFDISKPPGKVSTKIPRFFTWRKDNLMNTTTVQLTIISALPRCRVAHGNSIIPRDDGPLRRQCRLQRWRLIIGLLSITARGQLEICHDKLDQQFFHLLFSCREETLPRPPFPTSPVAPPRLARKQTNRRTNWQSFRGALIPGEAWFRQSELDFFFALICEEIISFPPEVFRWGEGSECPPSGD